MRRSIGLEVCLPRVVHGDALVGRVGEIQGGDQAVAGQDVYLQYVHGQYSCVVYVYASSGEEEAILRE